MSFRGFQTAFIYVDLDGFKFINDTLGHEAGDRGRCDAGAQRRGCACGSGKFRLALSQPFHVAGLDLHEVSASVGVAIHPRDGADTVTLRGNADAAMYEARLHGRNQIFFFTPEMLRRFRGTIAAGVMPSSAAEERQLPLEFPAA